MSSGDPRCVLSRGSYNVDYDNDNDDKFECEFTRNITWYCNLYRSSGIGDCPYQRAMWLWTVFYIVNNMYV